MNIAIIGAGASGVSTAYELLRGYGTDGNVSHTPTEKITVFEKESSAGGRAKRVEFAGTDIEIGATIIHSANKYICELMDYAGVARKKPDLAGDGTEYYGFWDGVKVYKIFNPDKWYFPIRMVLSYGIISALRFNSVAKKCIRRWQKLYQIQGGILSEKKTQKLNNIWSSIGDFFEDTKLENYASRSYLAHNRRNLIGDKWTLRFSEPILNNMFNQDAHINALSGNIALAGTGLGGELFQIDGGNGTLFAKVLDKLASEYKLNVKYDTTVARIRIFDDCIKIQCVGSKTWQKFDKVVIATPLELANIEIEYANDLKKNALKKNAKSSTNNAKQFMVKDNYNLQSNYSYGVEALSDEALKSDFYALQRVYVTLVEGELDRKYFNLKDRRQLPTTIFCRANVGLPYKSIGITGKSASGSPIYKIFSDSPLSPELLPQMFSKINQTKSHFWHGAFNDLSIKYSKKEQNTEYFNECSFELAPRLYYPNAIERVVTTVEVAAVMGVNVAHLIASEG